MTVSDKVNLARLAYVVYEHPNREKFLQFAQDFGFESAGNSNEGDVLLRGYGPDPYIYVVRQAPDGQAKKFYGSGFLARTEQDFQRACQLDGAQVKDITALPGGGRMVSIPDVNGFEMQIVYGQEERPVPDKGVSNIYEGQPNVNGAINKSRKGECTASHPKPL
jgi:hypothetical protein